MLKDLRRKSSRFEARQAEAGLEKGVCLVWGVCLGGTPFLGFQQHLLFNSFPGLNISSKGLCLLGLGLHAPLGCTRSEPILGDEHNVCFVFGNFNFGRPVWVQKFED